MPDILFPLVLAAVGLVIGIPSYVTRSRRWPGMIAGFDPARCTDVDGLTRWVGNAGMVLGGAGLAGAAAAYIAPQFRGLIGLALAMIILACTVVTSIGCQRFTRR